MAQENEKELQQLKNRFHDLAERSHAQGVFTFTGFLGLSDQEVFWQEEPGLRYAGYTLYGGCDQADRVVVRFGDSGELGYETDFPVVCIHIALMNLGIERSTVGDIRAGGKQAYLFCLDSVASFICDNLIQVKHTRVRCSVTKDFQDILQEEPETVNIQVQSLRVDAVISRVYNFSREKSLALFRTGKVYVNGRLCENNSRILKSGETVNARGFGKFVLTGEARETRKGRLAVDVAVYR